LSDHINLDSFNNLIQNETRESLEYNQNNILPMPHISRIYILDMIPVFL